MSYEDFLVWLKYLRAVTAYEDKTNMRAAIYFKGYYDALNNVENWIKNEASKSKDI